VSSLNILSTLPYSFSLSLFLSLSLHSLLPVLFIPPTHIIVHLYTILYTIYHSPPYLLIISPHRHSPPLNFSLFVVSRISERQSCKSLSVCLDFPPRKLPLFCPPHSCQLTNRKKSPQLKKARPAPLEGTGKLSARGNKKGPPPESRNPQSGITPYTRRYQGKKEKK